MFRDVRSSVFIFWIKALDVEQREEFVRHFPVACSNQRLGQVVTVNWLLWTHCIVVLVGFHVQPRKEDKWLPNTRESVNRKCTTLELFQVNSNWEAAVYYHFDLTFLKSCWIRDWFCGYAFKLQMKCVYNVTHCTMYLHLEPNKYHDKNTMYLHLKWTCTCEILCLILKFIFRWIRLLKMETKRI